MVPGGPTRCYLPVLSTLGPEDRVGNLIGIDVDGKRAVQFGVGLVQKQGGRSYGADVARQIVEANQPLRSRRGIDIYVIRPAVVIILVGRCTKILFRILKSGESTPAQ